MENNQENQKKKKKQHNCEYKKWIEEVYTPWYKQATEGDPQDSEGDEGGNPGGPPPPPPSGGFGNG